MSRRRNRGAEAAAATRSNGTPPTGRFPAAIVAVVGLLVVIVGCTIWWFAAANSEPSAEEIAADLSLATAHLNADRTDAAVPILDRLLTLKSPPHKAIVYRAQIAANNLEFESATELLRRIPDDSPSAAAAAFLRGTIALQRNQAVIAEREYRAAVQANPKLTAGWERLTQLFLSQMRGRDVRWALTGVVANRQLSLDELVVYSSAGEPYYSANERLSVLEKYTQADRNDLFSQRAVIRYKMLAENMTEAWQTANNVLNASESDRGQTSVLMPLLAELAIKQNRSDVASSMIANLELTENSMRDVARADAWLAFAAGDWKRTIAGLSRWLVVETDDTAAIYKLGQAAERAGDRKLSVRILKLARLQEELLLLVYRIRRSTGQRQELLLPVLCDVADRLLALNRPHEAALWLQHVADWAAGDERWRALAQRCEPFLASPPPDDAVAAAVRPLTQLDWKPGSGDGTVPDGLVPKDSVPDGAGVIAKSGSSSNRANLVANSADAAAVTDNANSAAASVPSRVRFRDIAAEAGVEFQFVSGGVGQKWLIETLGGGVAVFDFDMDGWPDLFFPQGGRIRDEDPTPLQSDRLFRNLGAGQFVDVTESAGLSDSAYSQGVAAGDFDNDGDPDLAVATLNGVVLYENNADGTFRNVTTTSGFAALSKRWFTSLAWGDLNGDAALDLYAATYVREPFKVCRSATGQYATCSPANYSADDDVLLLNSGDGRFEDISSVAGIRVPDGKGLGLVVADFDNDRLNDVYVANDGTPNFLFQNLGPGADGKPRFEEVALLRGCAVNTDGAAQAGMGISCEDFDGNGFPDLYVTNFFREYNTLYLNRGDTLFDDATQAAGLVEPTLPRLGFGVQAADFDLSGHLDLFVANGHIDDFGFRDEPWKMPPQFFENTGTATFREASSTAGEYFDGQYLGRGVARGDFNRDGLPDLVVVHQDRSVAILQNETESPGGGVTLRFVGVSNNRDGLGVRVTATQNGDLRTWQQTSGDGFFCTNERGCVIGCGTAAALMDVKVEWPDGTVTQLGDLSAGTSRSVIQSRSN